MEKKKITKIIKTVVIVLFIVLLLSLAASIPIIIKVHSVFSDINKELGEDMFITKVSTSIEILENDERCYKIFTEEYYNKGKYGVLWQFDDDVRIEIGNYMKENNLQIKPGIYYIKNPASTDGVNFSNSTTLKDVLEKNILEFEEFQGHSEECNRDEPPKDAETSYELFSCIEISENDERSYKIFTEEYYTDGKYSALWNFDDDVRIEIGNYMKENNLQIKPGIYDILKYSTVNGETVYNSATLKDVLEENILEFEECQENTEDGSVNGQE